MSQPEAILHCWGQRKAPTLPPSRYARSPLEDLPDDIWDSILQYIPLADLTRLRSVSARWRGRVDSCAQLWGCSPSIAGAPLGSDRPPPDPLAPPSDASPARPPRAPGSEPLPWLCWRYGGSDAHHLASLGLLSTLSFVCEPREIDALDRLRRTPLFMAALGGNAEDVAYLLALGARCDPVDAYGESALCAAARVGREASIRIIAAAGASLERPCRAGAAALSVAARAGHLGVVRALVSLGACLDAVDAAGRSAAWWAARSGEAAVLELLASAGASLGLADRSGVSPLRAAVEGSHAAAARVLLTRVGADAAAIDAHGLTPADRAAQLGAVPVLEALAVAGALSPLPPRQRDGTSSPAAFSSSSPPGGAVRGRQSPLWWASACGHASAVACLMRLGLDPDDADPCSLWSPLWEAANRGHLSVVEVLCAARGVVVDQRDKDGRTPLWAAASNGHVSVVRALLRAGADKGVMDRDGRRAVDVARRNRHWGLVGLLMAEGRGRGEKGDGRGGTTGWGRDE